MFGGRKIPLRVPQTQNWESNNDAAPPPPSKAELEVSLTPNRVERLRVY